MKKALKEMSIGVAVAVLLITSIAFVSANTQPAAKSAPSVGCGCGSPGCDGSCGGQCDGTCGAQTCDGACGAGESCGAACGGTCGAPSCGCGA